MKKQYEMMIVTVYHIEMEDILTTSTGGFHGEDEVLKPTL